MEPGANKPSVSDEKLDEAARRLKIEKASTIRPQANLHEDDIVDRSHFELLKVLGAGGFGKVFLVRKKGGKDDGELYAMKVIKKVGSVRSVKQARSKKREREILEIIRGTPFTIKLHYAFHTASKMYLVFDYAAGGELGRHIWQREYSEHELRLYIAEVIVAVEHFHSLGIVHRDIKLDNVMLDAEGHIVVVDFGIGKALKMTTNGVKETKSFCGSIQFMAPEVIKTANHAGYSFSPDWWTVGILAYQMATKSTPFAIGEDTMEENYMSCSDVEDFIFNQIKYEEPEIPTTLSAEFRDLIKRLLVKDPSQRLGSGLNGVDEIKSHKFFDGLNWEKLANREIEPPDR